MNRILLKIVKTLCVLLGLAALGLFGLIFYLDNVLHDGHMHFPENVYGNFVMQPQIFGEGEGREVRWELPVTCSNNAYQAVTQDYVMDGVAPIAWFGGEPVCTEASGRVSCAVRVSELASMSENHDVWFIAQAYVCPGGDLDYYISERLTVPVK